MVEYEDYELRLSFKLYWRAVKRISTILFDRWFYEDWWDSLKEFVLGCFVFVSRLAVLLLLPFSALLGAYLDAAQARENQKILKERAKRRKALVAKLEKARTENPL